MEVVNGDRASCSRMQHESLVSVGNRSLAFVDLLGEENAMNWEAIGAIGQLLSSITVFVTLGYLAVQVRQVNRNSALAAMQANRAQRQTWFVGIRDSPHYPRIQVKLDSKEALDAEDAYRLRMHLACEFGLVYSEWVFRDIGVAGEYLPADQFHLDLFASRPEHLEW